MLDHFSQHAKQTNKARTTLIKNAKTCAYLLRDAEFLGLEVAGSHDSFGTRRMDYGPQVDMIFSTQCREHSFLLGNGYLRVNPELFAEARRYAYQNFPDRKDHFANMNGRAKDMLNPPIGDYQIIWRNGDFDCQTKNRPRRLAQVHS